MPEHTLNILFQASILDKQAAIKIRFTFMHQVLQFDLCSCTHFPLLFEAAFQKFSTKIHKTLSEITAVLFYHRAGLNQGERGWAEQQRTQLEFQTPRLISQLNNSPTQPQTNLFLYLHHPLQSLVQVFITMASMLY